MLNVYEQVSRNKLRSTAIILAFIAFISLSAYLITQALELDYSVTVFAFIASLFTSGISYFFGDKIVLGLNSARPASRQVYFDYYTTVENLSLASQVPMPKIYIQDSPSPNAFAAGTDPKNSVICVTTGLLEKLNRTELEGVIAHELSHIKNYDVRLLTIVSVLIGSLSILINMSRRARYSRDRNRNSSPFQIIGVLLIILAPIIAKLIQLALSRQREFLADASAVKLTRQPQGLIQALEKISSDPNVVKQASTATANLYISNPFKADKLASLFSTHPPTEKRIEALRQML